MPTDRLSKAFCFDAFIHAAQHLANLSPGAALLNEALGIAKTIFQTDLACLWPAGQPEAHVCLPICGQPSHGCPLLSAPWPARLQQIMDNRVTALETLALAGHVYQLGLFPVIQQQQGIAVIVAGYASDAPLPQPVLDSHQAIAGLLGSMLEKQASEQRLSTLHRRHQMILEAAGEGIFGLDCNGKHTFVNPAAARMLGYRPEELLGQHSHTLWHHHKPDGRAYPEDECPIYAVCHTRSVHGGDNEFFIRRDGGFFPVEYTSTPIQEGSEIIGAVVIFRDIGERKRAETALLEHQQRIEALLRQEQHLRRLITTVSEVNQLLLTAESLEDLLVGSCERLAAYEDYALAWIAPFGERGGPARIYWACLEPFEVPLLQDRLAGSPACLTTETVLAAESLAQNRLVARDTGQAEEESEDWQDCMAQAGLRQAVAVPLKQDAYSEAVGMMGIYSTRDTELLGEELAMLRELAGDIGFAINAFRQRNALLQLNQSLEQRVKDEVQQRLAQEKILLSQSRLAAMGEMLGAIAHQWRQPLNALALNVQDIEDAHHFGELDDAYLKNSVAKIMQQVQFLSQTINDFRNFFRPDKESVRFSLARCVGDAMSLISASLRNNSIEYVLRGELEQPEQAGELYVNGYPNEFKQTLLNLLANAKDAIIEHRHQQHLDKTIAYIELCLERLADRARLTVTDEGGGIAPEILDKIFEPFFTTKEEGKGTGIGLYMAKMIVEHNMGGKLYAENAGAGARFTIELPL